MKIAHLSDLHLGYASNHRKNNNLIDVREQDGYDAFNSVIEQVINEGVDCVVIGGDTFHSPNPSIRSIIVAQEGFRKLAKAGIKIYNIAGNHDTNDIAGDIAASRVLHDEDRHIFSHAEPYVNYEIGDGVILHMISHHMYSQQEDTMSKIEPIDGAINILTTHGSLIDPILDIQLKAEQSPREIVIPDYLIRDNRWDSIMLGHIHERGFVGSSEGHEDYNGTPILYNGSLVRRGFADKEGNLGRGWTLWEIDSKGNFTHKFFNVWQRPQFDLPVVDGAKLDSNSDITETIVGNVEKAMEGYDSFDISNAPIVRQKIVNITPAQKSGIDWREIEKHKKNMLSWQTSFTSLGNSLKKNSIKNNHEDNENIDVDIEDSSEIEDLVKTMRNNAVGNLITDFDSFVKTEEVEKNLHGFNNKQKQLILKYSKDRIEEAYNNSLNEE